MTQPTREIAASGPNAEQIEYWNETTGPKWVALADDLDRMIGPLGERTTRFYDFSGTRFALVYESPDKGGTLKVTAIYLQ